MEQFIDFLKYQKNLSPQTIAIYLRYINSFVNSNNTDMIGFLKEKKWSNSTIRVFLSSMLKYYEFNQKQLPDKISFPKVISKKQNWVDQNEYFFLINKLLTNKKTHLQKRIIIRLLYETGIRASELLYLRCDDILKSQILVRGKGDKQRYVWVSEHLANDIKNYLLIFPTEKFLFNFGYKNLYKKIRGLGKHINKKLTPHMFRRGFATYCVKKNVDIYSLSQMMGHSDINTTKLYIYDFDLKSKMENLFQ